MGRDACQYRVSALLASIRSCSPALGWASMATRTQEPPGRSLRRTGILQGAARGLHLRNGICRWVERCDALLRRLAKERDRARPGDFSKRAAKYPKRFQLRVPRGISKGRQSRSDSMQARSTSTRGTTLVRIQAGPQRLGGCRSRLQLQCCGSRNGKVQGPLCMRNYAWLSRVTSLTSLFVHLRPSVHLSAPCWRKSKLMVTRCQIWQP